MYDGNERLINNGTELPYSMLNFWQSSYSNLLQNMQRGKFAEYVVKCALESNGIDTSTGINTSVAPYDLNGPRIPSKNRAARVEVKSAAFVQLWKIRHPENANFRIAPAVAPVGEGDYPEGAPKQRNNDVYVFTLYTATDQQANILDLSLWRFYVMSTYEIESDPKLCDRKTITLKTVRERCKELVFDDLCGAIEAACEEIPADFESKQYLMV